MNRAVEDPGKWLKGVARRVARAQQTLPLLDPEVCRWLETSEDTDPAALQAWLQRLVLLATLSF